MTEPQEKSLTEVQRGEQIPVQLSASLTPFASVDAFRAAWQMAAKLSQSQMVPKRFQGRDEGAIMDCLLALDMAHRTRTNPLMVLQNLYIVHGTPAWSGQFVIAMINQSGLFAEPLHFEFVGTKGSDDWGCYAITTSKSGKEIKGPTVDIAMAKAEGWLKNPKWHSMPELMLRYRAGAWFGRTECPELMMGIATREEVVDKPEEYIDAETGEVVKATKLTGERPAQAPQEPSGRVLDMSADVVVETKASQTEPASDAPPEQEQEQEQEQQQEQAPPVDDMLNLSAEEQLNARGYYWDTVRGAYFNKHNERWNPEIHGTAKATQGPIVNSDGHFRARRGTQVEDGSADASQTPSAPPPASEQTPAAPPDPLPDSQAKEPEGQPEGWE